METIVITSVLGFDFNVEIKDQNDCLIKTGAHSVYPENVCLPEQYKIIDKNVFNHYNEALLEKLRQHRRLND